MQQALGSIKISEDFQDDKGTLEMRSRPDGLCDPGVHDVHVVSLGLDMSSEVPRGLDDHYILSCSSVIRVTSFGVPLPSIARAEHLVITIWGIVEHGRPRVG
jgi:hypothetical protein